MLTGSRRWLGETLVRRADGCKAVSITMALYDAVVTKLANDKLSAVADQQPSAVTEGVNDDDAADQWICLTANSSRRMKHPKLNVRVRRSCQST